MVDLFLLMTLLCSKAKRIRFYGIETVEKKNKFKGQYYSNINGFNSRLDEIQSTILNIKLKNVDTYIKKRKGLVKIYMNELSSTSLKLPYENPNCEHVYHLFTIYHSKAELIMKKLLKKGTNKSYLSISYT